MTRTTHTTTARRPGIFDRLRGRKARPAPVQPAEVTTKRSKNPITGTTTTTRKTKTHPHGIGHHGHGGQGPLASEPVHHRRRKVTMGDKVSGAMMKLEGTVTRKPGKKAAGTRRMHGTDGRGSHRVY